MELIAREVGRISQLIFGDPEVLNETDAVLAIEVASYVNRKGLLGTAAKAAIQAIVALSQHDPDQARRLMAELS